MLEVFERSIGGFDIMDFLKLHINFQITTFLQSGPTPGFSRTTSKCHPWSLRGRWRFPRGVLVVVDIMIVPRIQQRICISAFIFLSSRKVVQLLGSPERHHCVNEDAGGS
jgi:hypothetical protein